MKRSFTVIGILLALLLSLVGCGEGTGAVTEGGEGADGTSLTPPTYVENAEELFTDRDLEASFDLATAVRITLAGTTASASSDAVTYQDGRVLLTEAGTYYVTGTLNDGQIVVNAPETAKLHIVFDGATVRSATSAALYVLECDKTVVTLAENSVNVLSNGGAFAQIDGNEVDAAVFSKQDLTFNGTGSLTVMSHAGHGIVSKDDLVVTGGTYTVTAASHGVDANDSVRIADGFFTVTAGKDAIRAENNDDTALGFVYIRNGTFDLSAEGDGISAGAYLQIENGVFRILTGGGSANGSHQSSGNWGGFPGWGRSSSSSSDTESTSMKGLKGQTGVLIANGTFTVDSADDAVHSNLSVTVNGGTFGIATGDDGFHADESLTVTGGRIDITKSYEGLEALHVTVSGGELSLVASDDGINAAGGVDGSGTGGRGDDMFGGPGGGRPRGGGMMGSSSGGSIVISGGTLYIEASGDGIDSNGTLEITGGYTVVCGPTQGDTAVLDYDRSAEIMGGTFIGTGASNMAQSISGSGQGVIALRMSGNQSAGTVITVTDQSGAVVLTHTPALSFGLVVLSSPDLTKGENYTVTVGASSGTFSAS